MNGQAVRAARQRKGIKTGAFAKELGISLSHLVNIESTDCACAIEKVHLMAAKLDVPAETLMQPPQATRGPEPTHPGRTRTTTGPKNPTAPPKGPANPPRKTGRVA